MELPRCILGLALLVCVVRPLDHTGASIGKLCTTVYDCKSEYERSADCIDGICQCKLGTDVHYGSVMEPFCYNKSDNLESTCSNDTCGENEVCRSVEPSQPDEKFCFCREEYMHVRGKCRKVSLQSALSSCSAYSDPVYACDTNKHSICSFSRCICFETYFPNRTSGECEHETNYLKAYGLSEYRVKPYEYCLRDSHCIEGLICKDLKCHCPEPCSFRKDEDVCYCGKYKIKAKEGPIVLGVCVGIAILTFWAYWIRRTFEKFLGKKRGPLGWKTSANSSQNDGDIVHNQETTSDVTSNEHPMEFIVHSHGIDEQSSTSCDLSPRQPENDTPDAHRPSQMSSNVLPFQGEVAINPLFPPRGSSLSINSSRPPTPSAPFLPAENSSSLDLPPTYHSLFPQQTDVNAPSLPNPLRPE